MTRVVWLRWQCLASVFRQSHYFHRTPSLTKTKIICIDVGRTEVEHDLGLIIYQGSQHLKGRPTWNLSFTRKGRLHQAPSVSTERTRYYLKLKTHCFLKNPGDGFYQILNTKILLKDLLTELALAVLALGQTGVFYQQVRCRNYEVRSEIPNGSSSFLSKLGHFTGRFSVPR